MFSIITINRSHEVISTIAANTWKDALNIAGGIINDAYNNGCKVFVKNTWDPEFYIRRKLVGYNNFVTAFGVSKWNTCKEDSEYSFTYIKKAA